MFRTAGQAPSPRGTLPAVLRKYKGKGSNRRACHVVARCPQEPGPLRILRHSASSPLRWGAAPLFARPTRGGLRRDPDSTRPPPATTRRWYDAPDDGKRGERGEAKKGCQPFLVANVVAGAVSNHPPAGDALRIQSATLRRSAPDWFLRRTGRPLTVRCWSERRDWLPRDVAGPARESKPASCPSALAPVGGASSHARRRASATLPWTARTVL